MIMDASVSEQLGDLFAPPVAVVSPAPGRVMPTPGVYFGLPADEYHAWDAVSNSLLSRFAITPRHARYPKPKTKSLELGDYVHAAILEPDAFETRYRAGGQCEAITDKGKGPRCSNDATGLFGGEPLCGVHSRGRTRDNVTIIASSIMRDTLLARDAVFAHEAARETLSGEHTEVSLAWIDEETGLTCKARVDHVNEDCNLIADLKSTRSAHRDWFGRDAFSFGYHRQAAWYREAVLKFSEFLLLDPISKLVAVELDSPVFPVGDFEVPQFVLDGGRGHLRALLRRYAKCKEANEWPLEGPGYSEGEQMLVIPGYGVAELEEYAHGSV